MGDQGSEGKLSPFLRSQRIKQVVPLLSGDVFDFGCGAGTLAAYCAPERYVGFDIDATALAAARRNFPSHTFVSELPPPEPAFDTVAMLASIEHLPEPDETLRMLRGLVRGGGRIVLTTPHPSFVWAHSLGALLGVFSREAAEEHHSFFDLPRMKQVAEQTGLRLTVARRFLGGANQLFVMACDP